MASDADGLARSGIEVDAEIYATVEGGVIGRDRCILFFGVGLWI